LLVTASIVPSSPILVTLMTEALSSSKSRILQEPHGVTSQRMPFFTVILLTVSAYLPLRSVPRHQTCCKKVIASGIQTVGREK
jgi:hypothetical protein